MDGMAMSDAVMTGHQGMKPTNLVYGNVRRALGGRAGARVLVSIKSRSSGLLRHKHKLRTPKLGLPTRSSHSKHCWFSGGK